MKLNNKIFNLGIAAVLSCSMLSVSAANTVDISMDYKNAITVSGSIDTADNTRPSDIMVRLTDSNGKLVYLDKSTTEADDEGKLCFEFGTELLSLALPSDAYTISVSGRNLNMALTQTIDIHGADRKLAALRAISDATTADGVNTAITGTTEGKNNYDVLKFDINLYNSLDESTFVDSYLAPKAYDLSVDATDGLTDEEIARIYTAIEAFYGDYTDAIASALFAAAESTAEVKAWYDDYYTLYGFDADTAITEVVDDVLGEADFVRRISENRTALAINDIKAYIYENALLAYIYSRTDAEVSELISDFPLYFAVGTSYSSLEPHEKAAAIATVAGVAYNTCADVTNALNAQAAAIIAARSNAAGNVGNNNNNNNGGGNGGYSVSLSGGSGVSAPTTAPIPPKTQVFSDLDDAGWAEDAILYLYNKGIVSGKPDGTFCPGDNITRAEFVKIAVEALGLEAASGQSTFADVSSESWYAPYVSMAYAGGLVTGDELGNFYPDADITRQDMVTILYRALKTDDSTSSEITFTDKDSISDYAYDAVAYFASQGIVNGIGDGSFGAARSATRAEAAAMFYRLIKTLLQ